MAHKSFSYKGYDIYLAARQASKGARGGHTTTMQVCTPVNGGRIIKKSFRYDNTSVCGYQQASEKAVKWIDKQ